MKMFYGKLNIIKSRRILLYAALFNIQLLLKFCQLLIVAETVKVLSITNASVVLS